MKKLITLLTGSCITLSVAAQALQPWTEGGFETQKYRNVFVEMGHSEAEVDQKLKDVFSEVFEGPNKVYFEVNDTMAYISDIKNNDVRTEGMSYGLMIAVQFDRKDIFDKIWRWGKHHMQNQDGPMKGFFAWSCHTDGSRSPFAFGPASDGELYFVTALIFASNRWGNDGDINYLAEAQNILQCAWDKEKTESPWVSHFINIEKKLITFVPGKNRSYTDPSYHLPAFYEVWARWANDGHSDFWRECANESRLYLHKSINEKTGLNPDYNNYDGTLLNNGQIIGDAFRFDSWRVPMNIALDYSWACADKEWQQNYGNTIHNFFYGQGIDTFVDQFNIDGTLPEKILPAGGKTALRHSVGLVATLAAAAIESPNEHNKEFVERLWNSENKPYEDGYFDAYYDGILRLFAFMHLSGNYRVIFPQNAK